MNTSRLSGRPRAFSWGGAALMCLLLAGPAAAQTRASLSGFVKDATSEETLILANVVLVGTGYGAATNTSGYYTLNDLPAGDYTVVASYIGYQPVEQTVSLAPGENRRLDILLPPDGVLLEGLEVTAEREDEETRNIGVTQLSTETIKQLPALLEPDVFRSLQLLPGVKAASDFSSGLYIRGGSPDQTLILLDRNTVYNPSHFFGFFSTFNPDAIKDVRLYKGGYPAPYGGRLGSVLDVYNKDGNRLERDGSLSIGLLSSRALVEGPYSRGSWMLAVRRSTLEPLLAALNSADIDGVPEAFYFYDVNGKVNFDAGQDDRLSLAFYTGVDDLELPFLEDSRLDLVVGNRTFSGNWTHIFSQRLFSNFTLTHSTYFSDPRFVVARTEFTRLNRVYDASAKGDFEYIPNDRHSITAGFWAGSFTMKIRDTFNGEVGLQDRIQSFNSAFYLQDTYRPSALWELKAGLRANYFRRGDYLRLEPRLSVEHRPTARVRLQLGYGRYYQFLTLITSELASAFDLWLTTDEGVPPAHGDQFVAGIKTALGRDQNANLDVEVYYRSMENLFEIDPFLSDAAGFDYADLFRFGSGYAYGTEWLLQGRLGKLSGFAGYTYGVTRRRFPLELTPQGDWIALTYAPKYDRTHDVKLVGNYDLGRRWRATGVFTYATGQAFSEPTGRARLEDNQWFSSVDRDLLTSEFNNARLPAYHRLDLGVTKEGRFFGLAEYELQLQVLNAYNRRNIWFYFFENDDDANLLERNEIPQLPVPIPNVAFTLRF